MADSQILSETGHFFEGIEKLLEVWFDDEEDHSRDLRKITQDQWTELLNNVNCCIIGTKSDESMTAYLLSESSLFVSRDRVILKTCGRTTLLKAVEPLLNIAREVCGFQKVKDVFYSRKNYQRPELQESIHATFDKEVAVLDKMFDYSGAAYALGRINRDCWYLYTIERAGVLEADQTLELLMQDLDPEKMKVFTKEFAKDGADASKKSGITDLIPGTIIDDYLFEPCGYSMNGILPNGQYFTIHITPESSFSYVSFETNVPEESYQDLTERVLKIFGPGKFLMTLFANQDSKAKQYYKKLGGFGTWDAYQRRDHQFCQLKNYNLTYSMYYRVPKE